MHNAFPRFRAVADQGLLVEFGETISAEVHAAVRRFDAALAKCPFLGFREATPAYTSVLIFFDPLVTDHETAQRAVRDLVVGESEASGPEVIREVLVCYDPDFGPDLIKVSERTGLDPESVATMHLAGDYSVYMYGFAPGYAYLAGVPEPLRLPRKPAPVRGVAVGSVMIAGPQCLVTTLKAPTGWWVIGRSPTRILRPDEDRPFLFDVGDRVRFRRIGRAEFERAAGS